MHKTSKDIMLVSILACLWAIQATVLLMQVLGFWHAPMLLNNSLVPEALLRVFPKWDILIYIFFISVALIIGKILFRYDAKRIDSWWIVVEGAVTFLMVSALFKLVIDDNSPKLAQGSLTALCIICILSKMFYPEIKRYSTVIDGALNKITWGLSADALWILVIMLLIYMPDTERVMAMIFMGDWLHHFDFFVMSVGWASLWGQLPYVNVLSQYGIGLPLIFAKITQFFGGFDYVPALNVMMWFVIIYFIFTYLLVRLWLRSAWMAGVAFLLVFRLQMFHYGVSPLIWSVPSASPLRFGLDVLWMAALWQHLKLGQSRWLIAAALYSGFAVYYMTSGGMCVFVTFYIYLMAFILVPPLRHQIFNTLARRQIFYLSWALPIGSAGIFFVTTYHGHLNTSGFWHHLLDYMQVFSNRGAMPMFESLKYRHFWAFFMSMFVLFAYLATLLYAGICLYTEKGQRELLFPALLCIYGLANYQYYVVRSAPTSYYVDALPFVLVVCFWLMQCLKLMPLLWQNRVKIAAVLLSFYALLTNQNYLAYPNLLNFSRNPMTDNLVIQRFPDRQGYFNNMYKNTKEADKLSLNDLGTTQEDIRTEDDFKSDTALVDYYRSHFDFSSDAALIQRLTDPRERVALISSFETKILIQAKRAPFFYHFPLLSSRPMTFRSFPVDAAHVPSFQSDTINEIQTQRPLYIFMEKVFLQDLLPASYQENNDRLLSLLTYIKSHYHAVEDGQYLVAFKRIG